jgi:hypothetical protein
VSSALPDDGSNGVEYAILSIDELGAWAPTRHALVPYIDEYAKPTDAKPTDAKPTDAKPTDAKPTDAKRVGPSYPEEEFKDRVDMYGL